ncbi:MAG TPA: hypothetical protein VL981_11060 [Candidatus Methylacidiphilales bacterium]|nr:hypothetical protein [Candidatus Methylacidiphilales bacterium]
MEEKIGFATPEEALASTRPLREKLTQIAGKTPRTVVDAFLPDPIDVAGLELKPIRMRTWLYLEKIGSPFLQGHTDIPSLEDLLRALYVITQPAAEVGGAIRAGNVSFDEAVEAFAERLPLAVLPELTAKLAVHLAVEFSPRADMVRDEEGSGTGPKSRAFSATAPGIG